ncbi:MAG: hypothetical protein HQL48_07820, partial [Gammaproteobacteria bacterium]|nr:hypothetical protein [Gammaproteobacteria bacterium]
MSGLKTVDDLGSAMKGASMAAPPVYALVPSPYGYGFAPVTPAAPVAGVGGAMPLPWSGAGGVVPGSAPVPGMAGASAAGFWPSPAYPFTHPGLAHMAAPLPPAAASVSPGLWNPNLFMLPTGAGSVNPGLITTTTTTTTA